MKILCDCGIVTDKKVGKWHHYSLNYDVVKHFISVISEWVPEQYIEANLPKESSELPKGAEGILDMFE